jgi:hypothetical protein
LQYADVSQYSISSNFKGCSETSAYCSFNQTPGKYPKEYIHLDPKHGESLKSRKKEELKKERRKLLLVANQI